MKTRSAAILFQAITVVAAFAFPRLSISAESATIYLTNGSYAAGSLVESPDGECFFWQGPAFTAPFQFVIDDVNAIHFPSPAALPQPAGEYCFELAGGDVLYGSLQTLDREEAVIESTELGTLHIERRLLRRMIRWDGKSDLLFAGPSGLQGWKAPTDPAAWREDAGQLVTDKKGAVLRRDFGVPEQASFEISLSWTSRPNFELALGVSTDDPTTVNRAFRIEVWDEQLVVQRETEREADVGLLQQIETGSGRIHLTVFLDQNKGRMHVFAADGKQIAELTATSGKPKSFGGLQIKNREGDIRLERLRISRWNGETPHVAAVDRMQIHAPDGAISYGEIESYDPERQEFSVTEKTEQTQIPKDKIHDVVFSNSQDVETQRMRALHQSGHKLSGKLLKVDQDGLQIQCDGIREPIHWPLAQLHAITVLQHQNQPSQPIGRSGRLELDQTRLQGSLVDATEDSKNCLLWQPIGSRNASALRGGTTARIVYRDPPPPPPKVPAAKPVRGRVARVAPVARPAGIVGQIQQIFDGSPSKVAQTPRDVSHASAILHLRSGDTIPCKVSRADEKGVHFKSEVSEATFIAHTQLKVLELMPQVASTAIAKAKKERLLTLPRMQRDNPPTQLIRSSNGDYLRGRLTKMDDKELEVEIRLETKALARASVARIIWLHPDEINPAAAPATATDQDLRVQALRGDGNRLTFTVEGLTGSILSGRSELLGECRIDLTQVDQLLIGSAIEQSASTLTFHQWKLKQAIDPLAPPEEGAADGDSEGLESPLVGKPAPDFQLELLDKKQLQLSEHKNKVLILDFWASWCGPCLQSMPLVDKVAAEFADQGVECFGINLQEPADRAQAAIARLQLSMPVALDLDGRVAEKYGVTSIPQTVIIGKDGTVVRLFVGSGARFDETLRNALQKVLSNN
jgi:thiol-disulfide isomerase/thioredoxin